MTSLMKKAIAAVRRLPEDRQNEVAELMLAASDESVHKLTPDEQKAVDEGLADAEAGRFVSDAAVGALFSKYRSA